MVPAARSQPGDAGVTGAPGRDVPPERAGQKAEAEKAEAEKAAEKAEADQATRHAADAGQKATTKKDKDDDKGKGR